MLRSLLRLAPRPVPPAALPSTAVPPSEEPTPPTSDVDHYKGPPAAPTTATESPQPNSLHDAAALQALGDIAHINPDDASLSDYQRMQFVQHALDACLPWIAASRDKQGLDAVFCELAAFNLCPESAGMLATVCHASAIVAMQRPGILSASRIDKANAASIQAVAIRLYDLPGMAPFKRILEIGTDVALQAVNDGHAAVHDSLFDCYSGLLTEQEPPPALEEIAFLQQALIVLGSVNVNGAYRVRHAQALSELPPPNSDTHLDQEGTQWVNMVHRQIGDFVKFRGGYGLGPKLWWSIEEAIMYAKREPQVLHVMFAPKRWALKAVTDPAERPSSQAPCDIHSHLMGTMYHAILHYINGRPGQGWRRSNKRKPVAVASHRDFLAHTFTALHRGIMSMPKGWIPTAQLEELHRVALDGVAQDCDAYTMRARLQAYASAAAASPRMAHLDEAHANKIAEAWEAFKSRLYTDEGPLDPPTLLR